MSIDANRCTRESILKSGVHQSGSWEWTYRSRSKFSVGYEVQTMDMGNPRIRLSYSWTWNGAGKPESADYHVRLATTCPRFGGLRWWFICPLIVNGRACGRRVGKLHMPPRARYFGCRHCHDLTYTSCQESHKHDRLYKSMALNMGWDIDNVKRTMRRFGKRR